RIPEGSLFIELYATHNPNNPTASGDLYSYDQVTTKQWYLNLAKMAPAGSDGINAAAQYPVWRLAISQPHQPANSAGSTANPLDFGTKELDTASYETEQYVGDPNATGSLIPGSTQNKVEVDRYVWFSELKATNTVRDADRIYYPRAARSQYLNQYI